MDTTAVAIALIAATPPTAAVIVQAFRVSRDLKKYHQEREAADQVRDAALVTMAKTLRPNGGVNGAAPTMADVTTETLKQAKDACEKSEAAARGVVEVKAIAQAALTTAETTYQLLAEYVEANSSR